VAVAAGLLRQQLRLAGDLVHHLNLSPPPGQLTRRARACLRSV
jgi:hypothetical protein